MAWHYARLREREAAGVPQHVRVSLEAQVSGLTSAAEATRYRALADENEQIADILEELRKINARVPRTPDFANLNCVAISRAVH